MAKFYTALDEQLIAFIAAQKMFFVATAPTRGRINLSPKGMDSLRCLDTHTVAYLDLTGSGNETAAHCRDNGRVTLMFCSFEEKPLILRLYGRGYTVPPEDTQWHTYSAHFPALPGTRQIVVLDIESVQTSCGFGVPYYNFMGERPTLIQWANGKGEAGLVQYRNDKNTRSIDGLPTGLGSVGDERE